MDVVLIFFGNGDLYFIGSCELGGWRSFGEYELFYVWLKGFRFRLVFKFGRCIVRAFVKV